MGDGLAEDIPHIVVLPEHWPRSRVYYYCPECGDVHGIPKDGAAVCPACARTGLNDVFSEIAVRLCHGWDFFEKTRLRPGSWLFKYGVDDADHSLWAAIMALGTYGELRALGFVPPWEDDDAVIDAWTTEMNAYVDPETGLLNGPCGNEAPHGEIVSLERYLSHGYEWNLRNRIFAADRYQAPPGQMADVDHLRSRDAFLAYMATLDWDTNPYGYGSWLTRIIDNHRQIIEAETGETSDEMIEFAHQWLDENQNPATGCWFGKNAPVNVNMNAIFKIYVSYEKQGWPIQYRRETIDYVLAGADPAKGYVGGGCSVFDPMMVLWVLRNRGEDYRADEIDAVAAQCFITWLERWDEATSWHKGGNWSGKHNTAIVLYMACLLLDQPYMKVCTVYNWRRGPMVRRDADGAVTVNDDITYSTEGYPFTG